jgi:outer membrane protein assembly factor BamB
MTRKILFSLALLVLAALFTGCASSAAASLTGSSWPGVTVYEDTIYIASGTQVFAIDPETSGVIWKYPAEVARGGPTFYAPPAVDGDMVVVTDYIDSLYALNRNTGVLLWPSPFRSDQSRFIGGAVIDGDTIYAATVDGQIHAVDRETAEEKVGWPFSADGGIWSTPLLADGMLYVTSLDHYLYAVNVETGQLEWRFPADGDDEDPGAMVGTPRLHDGVLYFGTFEHRVYALEIETQDILWTYETTNWVWSSPIVDEETGLVVGGDLDGHVFALDMVSGETAWTFNTGGPVVGAPLLDEREEDGLVVYITSGDAKLYTLDMDDGSKAAPEVTIETEFTTRFLFFKTGSNTRPVPIYAPPVLVDDLILISSHQPSGADVLFALERESLLERWTWNPSES